MGSETRERFGSGRHGECIRHGRHVRRRRGVRFTERPGFLDQRGLASRTLLRRRVGARSTHPAGHSLACDLGHEILRHTFRRTRVEERGTPRGGTSRRLRMASREASRRGTTARSPDAAGRVAHRRDARVGVGPRGVPSCRPAVHVGDIRAVGARADLGHRTADSRVKEPGSFRAGGELTGAAQERQRRISPRSSRDRSPRGPTARLAHYPRVVRRLRGASRS